MMLHHLGSWDDAGLWESLREHVTLGGYVHPKVGRFHCGSQPLSLEGRVVSFGMLLPLVFWGDYFMSRGAYTLASSL